MITTLMTMPLITAMKVAIDLYVLLDQMVRLYDHRSLGAQVHIIATRDHLMVVVAMYGHHFFQTHLNITALATAVTASMLTIALTAQQVY